MNRFTILPVTENVKAVVQLFDYRDLESEEFDYTFDTFLWFTMFNNGLPSRLRIPIQKEFMQHIHDSLKKELRVPAANIFRREKHLKDSVEPDGIAIFIRRDLIIDISEFIVEVFYSPGTCQEFLKDFVRMIRSMRKKFLRYQDQFYLIVVQHKELKIKRFQLKPLEISINENYNDDLLPIHDLIMNSFTNSNGKGVVLLHGEPGTGKTTYIRFLARTLKKKVIFIPPQFSVDLTSSGFINLMMQHPDSVIIIEDAENIIEDRNSGRNISIAGLLNIADGLLSYCLKIRIICTFNTGLSRIDPALMRKGRLTALYEFKKLTAEKSRHLAGKLGLNIDVQKPMTLSDLFNYSDPEASYQKPSGTGFRTGGQDHDT